MILSSIFCLSEDQFLLSFANCVELGLFCHEVAFLEIEEEDVILSFIIMLFTSIIILLISRSCIFIPWAVKLSSIVVPFVLPVFRSIIASILAFWRDVPKVIIHGMAGKLRSTNYPENDKNDKKKGIKYKSGGSGQYLPVFAMTNDHRQMQILYGRKIYGATWIEYLCIDLYRFKFSGLPSYVSYQYTKSPLSFFIGDNDL